MVRRKSLKKRHSKRRVSKQKRKSKSKSKRRVSKQKRKSKSKRRVSKKRRSRRKLRGGANKHVRLSARNRARTRRFLNNKKGVVPISDRNRDRNRRFLNNKKGVVPISDSSHNFLNHDYYDAESTIGDNGNSDESVYSTHPVRGDDDSTESINSELVRAQSPFSPPRIWGEPPRDGAGAGAAARAERGDTVLLQPPFRTGPYNPPEPTGRPIYKKI